MNKNVHRRGDRRRKVPQRHSPRPLHIWRTWLCTATRTPGGLPGGSSRRPSANSSIVGAVFGDASAEPSGSIQRLPACRVAMTEVMWAGSADLLTKPWTPSLRALRSTPGRACRVKDHLLGSLAADLGDRAEAVQRHGWR
ncbi:hypothetical protein ACGGAQ_29900 [Micromonospora sp. NPDC047557]|uniref:hypothetical protein n=1 Tax=Micromonospora sp. NPDC047557 TaxID=3364250 RepID=UPI0037161DBB